MKKDEGFKKILNSAVRSAKNKFKDMKKTKVVYMTYVLTFPDGEAWQRQQEFSAHDLDLVLKNMIMEHKRDRSEWKLRAEALWRAGECWWKDEAGVEHMILIEDVKRPKKWGVDQKGFAEFKGQIAPPPEGVAT